VGPRAGLDGRKMSPAPGFDPGPSSPYSVAIPTELPGPHYILIRLIKNAIECGGWDEFFNERCRRALVKLCNESLSY